MLTDPAGTVIVGAGHAGFTTATTLRDAGQTAPITLVNAEPGLPYQRPPLSKAYLLGKADRARVAFRPETFYERKKITLLSGRSVITIDRAAQTVRLDSGDVLGYRHLVLATGSAARELPIPGCDLPGVFSLRDVADAEALRLELANAKAPVVVGGGFIGLEFAAIAATLGLPATVLEAAPRLLIRSASGNTARFLAAAHRRWGNRVVTDARVIRLVGDTTNGVAGVELADGEVVPTDLVLVGVGAHPATTLAAAAGLAVADGILVNRHLCTTDAAIFAAGDCARFTSGGGTAGLRLESVQNATDQARTVARAICGESREYSSLPWFWSDQRDIKLQMAGDSTGCDATITMGDPGRSSFSTLCFRDGSLIAVESVNSPSDHVAARKLLARVNGQQSSFSPEMITSGFTLASYVRDH